MRRYPGFNGLRKPKKPILEWYLAGEIDSVGKDVKQFRKGDHPLKLLEDLQVLKDAGPHKPAVFWAEYREAVTGGLK